MRDRAYCYTVDQNDVIQFVNSNFIDFAEENAARHRSIDDYVGHSLWDFICDPGTAQLYKLMLNSVRANNRLSCVDFRCDGPAVRRHMKLFIEPIPNGLVKFTGRILQEELRDYQSFFDSTAPRGNASVFVCGVCRKIKVDTLIWAEIEDAMSLMTVFSRNVNPMPINTVCPTCVNALQNPREIMHSIEC